MNFEAIKFYQTNSFTASRKSLQILKSKKQNFQLVIKVFHGSFFVFYA